MSGTVYLVGAGPGAPDLLTLRAVRLLARADVVLHDALVHPGTLALARRARKIAVGKRCGRRSTAQRFIEKQLVDAARAHAVVVRLKGGDPLLFGRAQEEMAALARAGIACEVVPGVSAAFAAAAELGVSLSVRGVSRSVVFATPQVAPGEAESGWLDSVLAADTAALYMAGGVAPDVAARLLARGAPPDTPVVAVESATLAERREHDTTLAQLAELALGSGGGPVILLLGRVFARRAARRCRVA